MKYEWKTLLGNMGVNALHLMDEHRSWWHFGLADTLQVLKDHDPDLLIGSSMGGYGALMFGGLLGKPARAFGPQTTIAKVSWDGRWEDSLERVREKTKNPELIELTFSGDDLHIHYCAECPEDRMHAERMAVRLFPHECADHPPTARIKDLAALIQ